MDCQEIIPGLLYLGSAKASKDLNGLRELGITHIVNLGGKAHFPGHLIYSPKVKIPDKPDSQLSDVLEPIFQFIEGIQSAKGPKGKVLVHCMGGVSRSPAVVIAYLMHALQLSYEDAYATVKAKRPGIRPREAFVEQLRDMELGDRPSEKIEASEQPP